MGVNASSQFLGAFCWRYLRWSIVDIEQYILGMEHLSAIAIVWLLVSFSLKQPPYLSSMVLRLPEQNARSNGQSQLLAIRGIEEVLGDV